METDILHTVILDGDGDNSIGNGFRLSYEMLAEQLRAAGKLGKGERVNQIDVYQDAIVLLLDPTTEEIKNAAI